METNPQIELAFNFLQYTGTNIFLTGKAGTGKTTFLQNLRKTSPKRMIVLAPTGVAAINAGGMTLHSFFQLPFGPYIQGLNRVVGENLADKGFVNKFSKDKINIIRSLDLLVIDEISMVRADLLDAVSDVLCRYRNSKLPFGGVQLLLIGDLQQLSPVVKEEEWNILKEHYKSAFFFNSNSLSATNYISIELNHVYRQSDPLFINLLNSVRDNKLNEQVITELNKRYKPDFSPKDDEGYITLTTHNYQAQQINTLKLNELNTGIFIYKAKIEGNFPEYSYPTPEKLELKSGAQVMFVKNDSSPQKRYYNGKIGNIINIDKESIIVRCKGDDEDVEVSLEEWTNTKYTIDNQTKEIIETVEGRFIQYPLKTAWAITIHKSQGLTFKKAIIDAAAAFSHGQVYVALSRCKTLEGLILSSPLRAEAVISDVKIKSYIEYIESNQPNISQLEIAKQKYYIEQLVDFFDYNTVQKRLQYVTHIFDEHLQKLYPQLALQYAQTLNSFRKSIIEVGERFKVQLQRMVMESGDYNKDAAVNERVLKGMGYFKEQMEAILIPLLNEGTPDIDNKEIKKSFGEAMDKLNFEVDVKMSLLSELSNGFNIKQYLTVKAKALVEKPKIKIKKIPVKQEIASDIINPILYKTISEWRKLEAEKFNFPVYTVLQQKALIGISNSLPSTNKELLKIPGIGKKVVEKYGDKLLEMVKNYSITTPQ